MTADDAPAPAAAEDEAKPRAVSVRFTPRSAALILCAAFLSWAVGHLLLVRPAKQALAHAQLTLLQAEREELEAETLAMREKRRKYIGIDENLKEGSTMQEKCRKYNNQAKCKRRADNARETPKI